MLERAYIGRRLRNDTERLEKPFDPTPKIAAEANKALMKKGVAKRAAAKKRI